MFRKSFLSRSLKLVLRFLVHLELSFTLNLVAETFKFEAVVQPFPDFQLFFFLFLFNSFSTEIN
jgi:hypothetical protein